jgi:sucrose phosphorylase
MIIGAYPETVIRRQTDPPALHDLHQLSLRLPQTAALHILPFGPSDGDGGFAPRDWFSVDPTFGEWSDICAIARRRRVMVDGIYNHVGLSHPWVEEFLTRGTGAHRLHVFPFRPHDAFKSPRGGSVFRSYNVVGQRWWAWQTFSSCSIDIRLDGVAYFGKVLGEQQIHHPLAIRYARIISKEAATHGLEVVPQLNCDSNGSGYFPPPHGHTIPLCDYGFSAALALTVITGHASHLVSHLRTTWGLRTPILRALRTHDGILMKPPFFSESHRDALCDAFGRYGVLPRTIEGNQYEFNVSFPYLCSLGTDVCGMWRRLRTSTVLLASLPGWCYIYLPILYGFRPEVDAPATFVADPRFLNRLPIPREFIERAQLSGEHRAMRQLLENCADLRYEHGLDRRHPGDSIDMLGETAVVLRRAGSRLTVIANFSQSSTIVAPEPVGRRIAGSETHHLRVEPLDVGVWVG